ncbi:MAG TPA: HlyD family efflux transporter periplasmic adaptor subunit [Blastocatellia bacterium]|nr:HlyD family efflux transporter periplasmic adaptor subunit [Blastocatellia bacterium]
MDIPRKSAGRKRQVKRIIYSLAAIIAIGAITVGVSRLKPAAPTVERSTVWIDTVKRGPMLRQVRGLGSLVPEEIRWIPATTQGRVERILVKPGAEVRADTVLIELTNPEAEQAAIEATSQLKAAEAEYISLRVQLERRFLDQKATAATVQADFSQAKLQAEVNEELAKQGLISQLNLKVSKVRAEEMATRNSIEEKRLSITSEEVKAQLAVQQERVSQMRALAQLRHSQVADLLVRASIDGVLQQMPVEVGQSVTPGTNLARVSDPKRLKAEIRVAETQVRDVGIGQRVTVDTRNGIIPGVVSRIDPASENATVKVDVTLTGELPRGARPDLSVDGTIELERLDDILYVGRPVHAQDHGSITLFKLVDGGKQAVRVTVKLGRSSVNTIELVDGLKEGEQVVLSDTSQWDNANTINLN